MVDMAMIQGVTMSLKAAGDMARGFLELKSMAEVQAKVIELQSAIMAAQSGAMAAQAEQASLLQQIQELKASLERMKAWEAQKERYAMVSPAEAVTLYALRESQKKGEPAHYICPHCYEDGRRSVMQAGSKKNGWGAWVCPACKCEAPTGYRNVPNAEFAPG